MDFKTYGFIGLGLIGGSIARAIKANTPESRIMAYTQNRIFCLEVSFFIVRSS